MTSGNSLLQELEPLKDLILHACEDIKIAERKGLKVKDMTLPENARNSCGFVSAAIIDHIDFSEIGEGYKATYTGIQTPAGNHYGVLLSKDGLPEEMSVIVDFTASQFGSDAPFPLIMDCWEWQFWTEEKLGRVGNWYHSYTW